MVLDLADRGGVHDAGPYQSRELLDFLDAVLDHQRSLFGLCRPLRQYPLADQHVAAEPWRISKRRRALDDPGTRLS
jgi:hypothetical protein